MPEHTDLDLRALANYQRRLVASAMEVVGRVLLVVSVVILLLAAFGVWGTWSVRAPLIVLSAGGLVVGIALAIAGDYLPRVPGTERSPVNAPNTDDVGDPAGA